MKTLIVHILLLLLLPLRCYLEDRTLTFVWAINCMKVLNAALVKSSLTLLALFINYNVIDMLNSQ